MRLSFTVSFISRLNYGPGITSHQKIPPGGVTGGWNKHNMEEIIQLPMSMLLQLCVYHAHFRYYRGILWAGDDVIANCSPGGSGESYKLHRGDKFCFLISVFPYLCDYRATYRFVSRVLSLPEMTSEWRTCLTALKAARISWFWKGSEDFPLVFHCNSASIIQRSVHIEVSPLTGIDVLWTFSQGSAAYDLWWKILEERA